MSYEDRHDGSGLRLSRGFGIAGGVVLLGGFLYLLTTLGLKKGDEVKIPAGMVAEQWQLSGQIDQIEQHQRELPDSEAASEAQIAEYERAVVMQRRILEINPPVGLDQHQRLERLEQTRDTLRASLLMPKIAEREAQLRGELSGTQRVEALGEVLKLQREVNRSRAAASFKDLVKETHWQRDLEAAEAEPLRGEVMAMHRRAQQAAVSEDWPAALKATTEALERMSELNRRYPRSPFADRALQVQLQSEETALLGAFESAEVEVYSRGAEAAENTGRITEAADYWQQAKVLQEKLNHTWPLSRFASMSRPELLEVRRQTVLAGALVASLKAEDREVTARLARRETLAAQKRIVKIQEALDRLATDYPKARTNDGGLVRKYACLTAQADGLREWQDGVYDLLVPLPGDDGKLLLRTEVLQALYVRVMKFNPSRNLGEGLPVDSVSWSDAREFCRRLGWMLGRAVALPSRTEIERALGDTSDPAGDAMINGYANLTSGLDEWLDASDEARDAPVLKGGHETEGSAVVGTYEHLAKDTRSRTMGFRVMVGAGAR